MIRSGLCQLTVQTLPKVVAFSSVPPVAAALLNKLSHRALSSKTASRASSLSRSHREDDELYNKSYSDAFDESDSLEAGKKEEPKHIGDKQQQREAYRLHPMFVPHFADLDNFFASTDFLANKDPFFSPLFRQHRSIMEPFMSTTLMPVLRRRFPRESRQTLLRASPAYEIIEGDGAYQIAVDVPEGLKASDIQVQVEKDGSLVHLSGQRETEHDGMKIMARFDKRFAIGPNMNADELTANFSDGTLVLTLPKIELEEDSTRRAIPITGKPHVPRDEELMQKDYSDTFDESDWAETGKQGGKAE